MKSRPVYNPGNSSETMPRILPVLLAVLLACANASAQTPAPAPPRPDPGGFLPPQINWVKPKPEPAQSPEIQAEKDDDAPESFEIPYIAAIARVAMALPVSAPGLVGRAANSFHQGCKRGVQKENARLWIDLYPAKDPETELAAYESALTNDAQFIVGPMSKSGVRALLKKFPNAAVPTILLQPPPAKSQGGKNYFVMTLDSAREAAALARRLLEAGTTRAVIVARQSPLGRRQAAAFSDAWREITGKSPSQFSASALAEQERDDLREMFDEFKQQTESESEQKSPPAPPAVFIAGDSEFARRARSYLPARYPAYAGSVARADEDGPAALQLEGLRFLEIPWLVNPDEADFGDAAARTLAERRFFALGADVCRAALHSADWSAVGNGWIFHGASGTFTLRDGQFHRQGTLSEYRDGRAAAVTDL